MKPHLTKSRVIITSAIGGILILGAVFVANGSEYEDAWLYIAGAWIVLVPTIELFFKKKNKSQ